MSDKPNARELLKEARAELAKAHDHLMELTAKLPMQYFGLVDGNIIQAEDCLISQLDAYLAAPSEGAMEMVRRIRSCSPFISDGNPYLTDSEAAALLKDYAERETAALRGLVRRMRDSGCSLAETIHGNEPCAKVFREAWDKACAEADKVVKP